MRLQYRSFGVSNPHSLSNGRGYDCIVVLSLYRINFMLKLCAGWQVYYCGSHIITSPN